MSQIPDICSQDGQTPDGLPVPESRKRSESSGTSPKSKRRRRSSTPTPTYVPTDMIKAIEHLSQTNVVRLTIPDRTPPARHWAPHAFTPSMVLTRALPPITPDAVPILYDAGADSKPDGDMCEIFLDQSLGQHEDEITNTYEVCMRRGPKDVWTFGLIVKIVDLATCGCLSDATRMLFDVYNAFDVAASLQGTVLPRMAGLFGNGTVFCFVFEDAGGTFAGRKLLQDSVRADMRSALDALFDAGVELDIKAGTGPSFFRRGRGNTGIKIAHLTDAKVFAHEGWRSDPEETASRRRRMQSLLTESYLGKWDKKAKELALAQEEEASYEDESEESDEDWDSDDS